MKKLIKTSTLALAMVITLTFSLFAKENINNKNLENSKKTLLSSIESNNIGLSISSIQILGELNSNEAVLPLLRILHNSENVESRIAASLSLYKIGDKRGIFALKMAAKHDNSKRVRKMCNSFYNQYLLENKIT